MGASVSTQNEQTIVVTVDDDKTPNIDPTIELMRIGLKIKYAIKSEMVEKLQDLLQKQERSLNNIQNAHEIVEKEGEVQELKEAIESWTRNRENYWRCLEEKKKELVKLSKEMNKLH
jgi:glycerol-3-phosphate dehydrogenase